ncbi:MAG: flagellin [Proteobacteria bacterium]|nr:flagellin [Pseudomonadota bacterium]
MSFRVNHNISALNAHRSLQTNNTDLSRSLERLSSGLKISRASDGPAAFAISEHIRSQVSGVNQAIENSEMAVSILQTSEANMGEITTLLNSVRQLVIHSLNEGANNEASLNADQHEIRNALETIHEIADKAQFGDKKLLDGSNGVSGTTTGSDLEFVGASMNTKDSREEGFEVKITQAATRSHIRGVTALTQEMVTAGEKLTVIADGKLASYTSREDDTVETTVQNLRSAVERKGLDLEITMNDANMIDIRHRKYGSDYDFQVSSSTAGVLSETGQEIMNVEAGKNVKGTINGESTTGRGQVLTGIEGAKCIDGLSVRYYADGKDYLLPPDCQVYDLQSDEEAGEAERPEIPEDGLSAGRVFVAQNSMKFQVGGNKAQMIGIALMDMKPANFAINMANQSGFESLADIDVREHQGAQDSLMLVDHAINQIASERGKLGAFQKNSLETNLSNLRVANENLISSESIIRDTDMAKEMAIFTRDQIKTNSSSAMLAHSNQVSENVLQLLN